MNNRVQLTENALRKTKHCIIPSIVSPVRQNVPVKCRPRRPTAADVAKLACTNALLGKELPPPNAGGMGFAALIKRSNESIVQTHSRITLLKCSYCFKAGQALPIDTCSLSQSQNNSSRVRLAKRNFNR